MEPCRLIFTVKQAQDHSQWLAVRNMGIGGSDAGAILGKSKYRSPADVWLEKTGAREPADLSGNEAVRAGILLEPVVARMFEEDTGKKVTRRGTLQSTTYPFMLANIDRQVVGEDAGLEIKTAGAWAEKLWEGDEIPDSYYCQCLHYMAVTGAKRWYIAALIGGQHFLWKTIERNETDIKILIDEETKFWDLVKTKTPPPIDSSAACGSALSYRYRDADPGSVIDLPPEAGDIMAHLDSIADAMAGLKEDEQAAKNALMEMMKENETGIWKGKDGRIRKVTWKATKPTESLRLSDIRKKDPEEYQRLKDKGFVTVRDAIRRLRIGK